MNYDIVVVPEFERMVKRLQRKYRHIKEYLLTLKQFLPENPRAGDAISGLHGKVFKVRLSSSDLERGKSGGLRVIYYFAQTHQHIYLLLIYSKSEKENIRVKEIVKLLKQYGLW